MVSDDNYIISDTNDELVKRRKDLDKKEKALKLMQDELEKKENIFNMKWKLLEYELSLLAKEKEEFYNEKNRHKYKTRLEEERKMFKGSSRINAGMYFLGVHDELSLKKRYRDLLKLFHPDNMNGDVDAMQVINKEYNELRKKYEKI